MHANKGKKRTPEQIARMRAARMAAAGPMHVRFWSKADRSGGPDACWLWTAHKKPTGYGMFGQVRERDNGYTVVHAHRIAWILAGNEAPVWPMVLDHKCRERSCVNPRHLRVVHQTENITIYARRKTKARNYTEVHELL